VGLNSTKFYPPILKNKNITHSNSSRVEKASSSQKRTFIQSFIPQSYIYYDYMEA